MQTQVLIAGGGIGGLTLAALCWKIGIPCKVLERSTALEPVGARISLAPNALRVLDQLGLYEYIRWEGSPVRKIRVYRNQAKWSEIDFQWLEGAFGYLVYSIERHSFHGRLYEAAGGAETVILGAEVVEVVHPSPTESEVTVVLADGRRYKGDVLVGADGVRSVVRAGYHGGGPRCYPVYRPRASIRLYRSLNPPWPGGRGNRALVVL
jgi:2-polyprenyl-6-methoxyphenol hydroxylase-like FAD-dependent oxidoreductase